MDSVESDKLQMPVDQIVPSSVWSACSVVMVVKSKAGTTEYTEYTEKRQENNSESS